ncbi:MAG: holo-ACP synthase [Pseudomonadota bacterium]
MIFGVGVDLLRVERMQKVFERHGERLVQRILMDAEIKELRRRKNPARRLAFSFAAKEAFVKALGTGFRGVGYRDAGVCHQPSGKPMLIYSARMRARLKREGICGGHVSLTDEGGMCCAMVVLEAAALKPRMTLRNSVRS